MKAQLSFFDVARRYEKLDEKDRLIPLNTSVPWEKFRKTLLSATMRERKSGAGRKRYDPVVMFKVLVLQSLYGLSDDEMEYQIRDRLSFSRFLGLGPNEETPDAKTIWCFRETLQRARVMRKLFEKFEDYLNDQGFTAQRGTIVDACMVEVPKQHNNKQKPAENEGKEAPEVSGESEAVLRQKDKDARWAKKNGKSYFGYKNHIAVDRKHKLIRGWESTDAARHDSTVFGALVEAALGKQGVWADAAYDTAKNAELLERLACGNRIQKQARGQQVLKQSVRSRNRKWAAIRKRVEHVFAFQTNSMSGRFIRTIGLARATLRIGINNLTYNFMRYIYLRKAMA